MPTRSPEIHEFEVYLPLHSRRKRVGTRKNFSKKNVQKEHNQQPKNNQNTNNIDKNKYFLESYANDIEENKPINHKETTKANENKEEKQKKETNKENLDQQESLKDNDKNVEFKPKDYLKVLKPEKNDEDKNNKQILEDKKHISQNRQQGESKPKQEATFPHQANLNLHNKDNKTNLSGTEPKSLGFALLLLWVSLFIDVINIIMEPTVNSPDSAMLSSYSTTGISLMLFLNGFLLLQIAYFKNWARLFFFIVSCIEIFPKFSTIFVSPSKMNLSIMLTIGMIALRIYGLHLVFTEPRNRCFKNERKSEKNYMKA